MRNKRKTSLTQHSKPTYTSSSYKGRNQHSKRYVVASSDEEDISTDEEEVTADEDWEINGILAENETHYLIDWVGNYSPSWEPKENANEVAVQIWEEKKRKEEQASKGNGFSTEQSSSRSPNSIFDECAETPAQELVRQQSSDSDLFVPLDSVPEARSQETNELPLSSLATENSSQSYADSKPTVASHFHSVFESCPRASIPPEYRLPDEVEKPPTQDRDPSIGVSARGLENPDLAGRTAEDAGTSRERQRTIVHPSPRAKIPETPFISLVPPNSEPLRAGPPSETSGPQSLTSSDTNGVPSSAFPARTSLANGRLLAGNSIPYANSTPACPAGHLDSRHIISSAESAPRNIPTTQTFTAPALGAVAHSASLDSGVSPSRNSILNSLPALDSLPLSLQHPSGHPLLGSTSGVASRPLITPYPLTSAIMDDQGQKKQKSSLADTMEKYSHIEGSTPREKIMNLYDKMRDKSTVETLQNEASATPSSPGDIEASEPPPAPGTGAPLSVRVDKDSSHADPIKDLVPETSLDETEHLTHISETFQTIQPSALTINHTEERPPGSVQLGPSEFAVPLPMDSRVKDDYERVLQESKDALEVDLSGRKEISESELERAAPLIQQVLERLSNAATHPDINVADHMKSAESKFEQEASWADYSSAKFLLLNYLIKAASEHDIHLVIMVRGEKTQWIVERYLQGKGFSYTRSREEMGSGTNAEVSLAKDALSFGVQLAQSDGIVNVYKAPSAIIALDSSLNTKSPSVEHMRTTFARDGHLLPVIRLMVANSSEHVELCYPGPSTPEHLSKLLQYSEHLRDIVGDLQDDALGVHEDANEIMTSLLSDNFDAFWSLPPVEPLRKWAMDESSQDEEPSQPKVDNTTSATSLAQKRVLEEDSTEPTPKKPRMGESQNTSELTVSSKAASQSLDSQIQFLEKNLIQMRASNAADIQKLRKELAAAQTRLLERDRVLESLQHRYETRTKDLHNMRRERDRLIETKANYEQRIKKQNEEIIKLKDERAQLKQDLDQAREALKTGGGDMAELEKAREEIRRLTTENAALERKADVANKQAEYTREQYQTASNAAAHSGNELRTLRDENEVLKRKVAGEATRLRELNIQNDESRHLTRIGELESLLSVREDLLQKKEDELREIRKNRPSTRSTSTQPRSPKLNANNYSRPTSPGINNNGSNFPGRGSALRFSSEMSL
ncbi:class II histone deacetylase complex subunits 2 and 3-domain-containing protein [Aspergillus nidulans var. acristatus]